MHPQGEIQWRMRKSLEMNNIKTSTEEEEPPSQIEINQLLIFRKKNDVIASNQKQEVTKLKERVNIFHNLEIGCQERK